MAKKSGIERAIENIQQQIDVLLLAQARLREQQAKDVKRKPRIVKPVADKSAVG